uniref:Ketimine reductase mu-crystallin n=1 Tax=Ciona savignyi TaxID=51511 RepID=H2Z2N6_CIOSA
TRMSKLKLIGNNTVRRVLKYEELIPAIETCLLNFSRGKIRQPVRSSVDIEQHKGVFLSMAAYDTVQDSCAMKMVSFYPNNTQHHSLPCIQSTILHLQPQTGVLLAVIEANAITDMRTAAASAVATKYLAPDNAKVLAIFGAGSQARSHFYALTHVQQFQEVVIIWNHTVPNGEKLSKEVSQSFKNVRFCASAKEAAVNADVIVTATNASKPFLKGEWLKNGVHINSVGACLANWREMDDDCMNQCDLYVDSREGALKESGDIILCQPKILGELGEVIEGGCRADRNSKTIFKSLGMAAEDVAASQLVWDKVKDTE